MKAKWALRFLVGVLLLAAYELFLDGTGIGMKERWSRLREWARK